MSKVTSYQDLLDNDHAGLMAECAARYPAHAKLAPKVKHMRRAYTPRSEADMLAEHNATMWATSATLINMTVTPWSR